MLKINENVVQAQQGVLLSEALRGHGLDLPCGGIGVCGRCRVRAKGSLSPVTGIERGFLSPGEINGGVRMACQARVNGDAEVWLLNGSRVAAMGSAAAAAIRDPLFDKFGLAADIGTTTICAALYGREGLIGSRSMKNPQTAYGADVISRVGHSLGGGGEALSGAVRGALSGMAASLAESAGAAANEIDAAVLAGNTAMLYLLMGCPPEGIARAPFHADRLFGEFAGLPMGLKDGARVYLPPVISAFAGADMVAALLASNLCHGPQTRMMADIGTNAEIALWHNGRLYACSAAAGPAFEGSGLSCGMYGAGGAIGRVWVENGKVEFSTIDGGPPAGLCGSGVLDALAVMLETGVIDESGAFVNGDVFRLAENAAVTQRDVRLLQLSKSAVRAGMEALLKAAGARWEDVSALYIAGGFGGSLNFSNAAKIGLLPQGALLRAESIGNASLAGASMMLADRALLEEAKRLASAAQTVRLDANPVFLGMYVDWMGFSNSG